LGEGVVGAVQVTIQNRKRNVSWEADERQKEGSAPSCLQEAGNIPTIKFPAFDLLELIAPTQESERGHSKKTPFYEFDFSPGLVSDIESETIEIRGEIRVSPGDVLRTLGTHRREERLSSTDRFKPLLHNE
jgi:hypothetical protein